MISSETIAAAKRVLADDEIASETTKAQARKVLRGARRVDPARPVHDTGGSAVRLSGWPERA